MKKILILVLGMVMASGAVFADGEEDKVNIDNHLARMQKNLGLTDQQVAQMSRIHDDGGSKKEVLAVLTNAQRAIMKERRAQMKGKGQRPVYPGAVEKSETTDSSN